jgi:hypothetical protein
MKRTSDKGMSRGRGTGRDGNRNRGHMQIQEQGYRQEQGRADRIEYLCQYPLILQLNPYGFPSSLHVIWKNNEKDKGQGYEQGQGYGQGQKQEQEPYANAGARVQARTMGGGGECGDNDKCKHRGRVDWIEDLFQYPLILQLNPYRHPLLIQSTSIHILIFIHVRKATDAKKRKGDVH